MSIFKAFGSKLYCMWGETVVESVTSVKYTFLRCCTMVSAGQLLIKIMHLAIVLHHSTPLCSHISTFCLPHTDRAVFQLCFSFARNDCG